MKVLFFNFTPYFFPNDQLFSDSKATAGPITGSALLIFISKDCVEKVSIWNKNVGSGPQINSITNTIVCVCLDTLCLRKYQALLVTYSILD